MGRGNFLRRAFAVSILFGSGLAAPTARAAPQASAAVTVGAAATELRSPGSPLPAFHLGGRADLLFLRTRERDMGVGPYVDFATEAFHTAEFGGGAEWLIPVSASYSLTLSGGAFGRKAPGFGWEPGTSATVFIGSHSYNFHSVYALSAGLFVQGRYGLGDARQADAIAGAQIDLALLALPFIFAYSAVAK